MKRAAIARVGGPHKVALRSLLPGCALVMLSTAAGAAPVDRPVDRHVLPIMPAPFDGKIASSVAASVPSFPARVTAPAGAPNIILIMTDDVGFGVASTFGGPVPTPNLDRLAAKGLIYNRFHTTSICSPSRAALLTGRNQHAVANGIVNDLATGYPGYNTIIPKSAATIAEVLRQNGYSTAMFGKHHNVPAWEETSAGPFDHWPTGLGFDYFYGFIGGSANQWHPDLVRGTDRVSAPDDNRPDSVLDRFLADDAIHWIHEQKASAPEKPFFVYYAPGTAHSPHQAPRQWIEKFKGRFDGGWDALRDQTVARQKQTGLIPAASGVTPRPEGIPAWATLSDSDRKVAARMMEVYAAMIAYHDAQIGRMLDEIDRMGQADNTLVIFIEGDNGASPEGGVAGSTNSGATIVDRSSEDAAWRLSQLDILGSDRSSGHFPVGWTWALNAPFPWMKGVSSHFGGTRNPMVVAWPGHIRQAGLRSQFHDITDVMPTVLEAAGIPAPTSVNGVPQQRVDGISFAYSFNDAKAADHRHTRYFEMMGTRAIYHDGWVAGTTPQRLPWQSKVPPGDVTKWPWELYNIDEDFAEANNLAARYPDKLRSLQRLWQREAAQNSVFPLDDSTIGRLRKNPYRSDKREFTYWGPDLHIPESAAPLLGAMSFSIAADVDIPAGVANGVLVASGGRFGGWSFYLKDGHPVALHAATQQPRDQFRLEAPASLPAGKVRIGYSFTLDPIKPGRRGGVLSISVDGRDVASRHVDRIGGFNETPESFDIGVDAGSLVSDDYVADPRFNGLIRKIVIKTLDGPGPGPGPGAGAGGVGTNGSGGVE